MGPVRIEIEGRIDASLDATWALLADRSAVGEWLDGVAAALGDGARLMLRRRSARGRAGRPWIEGTVRDAVPRQCLSLALERPTALLAWADVEIRLRAAEGGTAFALRVIGAPTALGALLAPLVRLRTHVAARGALRGFRSALAARQARARGRALAAGAGARSLAGLGASAPSERRTGGELASSPCV